MNKEKIRASMQYDAYLKKHTEGVRRAFESIMLPLLREENISQEEVDHIQGIIEMHDKSKYGQEEFPAYRDYFYDPEHNSRSSEAFNLAWMHHQNHNPHHWQYWCLINDVDEPQVQALDMPKAYVVEMLCDWQSAGNHYGNTAYDWYEKQKDKMILSENTRKLVEKYIEYFK